MANAEQALQLAVDGDIGNGEPDLVQLGGGALVTGNFSPVRMTPTAPRVRSATGTCTPAPSKSTQASLTDRASI